MKKRRGKVFGIVYLLLCMIVTSIQPCVADTVTTNIIADPEFSTLGNDNSVWQIYLGETAEAAFTTRDEGGIDVNISNVGTYAWDVQVSQSNLSLVAGDTYTVKISIVSSVSRNVNVELQNYNQQQEQMLGTLGSGDKALIAGRQETIEFTTEALETSISTGKLYMGFGQVSGADAAGTITVTNVQVLHNAKQMGESGTGDSGKPENAESSKPTELSDYTKLVWSDEFGGASLNTETWNYDIGGGNIMWGNNELQNYTSNSKNVAVENGNLRLTALKENSNGFGYSSGRIQTKNKKTFLYGYIEARIKTMNNHGFLPAFWLLGQRADWSTADASGNIPVAEIDIMEHLNEEDMVYGTIHWTTEDLVETDGEWGYHLHSSSSADSADNWSNPIWNSFKGDDWHTYGLKWDEQEIVWYVDGVAYKHFSIVGDEFKYFHEPCYIILNLAVGGDWPGSPNETSVFPNNMYVDYVRIYEQETSEEVETPGTGEEVETPGNSEEVEKPGSSEEVEKPGSSEEVEKPGSSEEVETPGGGVEVETPGNSEAVETPGGGVEVEQPGNGEEVETPGSGEEVEAPGNGEEVETPGGGEEVDASEKEVAVTGIQINKNQLTLMVGAKEQLTASVFPTNASNQGVKWESLDPTIASVSDGNISAKKCGQTAIIVTSEYGDFQAVCVVTVIEKSNSAMEVLPDNDKNGNGDTPTQETVSTAKPKKVKNVKLQKRKRTVNVSWKKTGKVDGYKIVYSTKKNFSKKKITYTSKTSKKLKNLKTGKKYYIKVCAYVKINGTKKYGVYSTVKKITVD